jgi:hypothetical protein
MATTRGMGDVLMKYSKLVEIDMGEIYNELDTIRKSVEQLREMVVIKTGEAMEEQNEKDLTCKLLIGLYALVIVLFIVFAIHILLK